MEIKKYVEIGEVIRIISKSSLIISISNLDSSIIPKEGEKVEIYSRGEPLYNSKGEKIAHFNQVKDTLKIKKVENKYIVCNKEKIRSSFSTASKSLASMFDSTYTVEDTNININYDEICPLKNYNKKIHVGDLARLELTEPEMIEE